MKIRDVPQTGTIGENITYLAKFHLLPVGQRIFIRTVQQINGWRDLPKSISARIPAQYAKRLLKSAPPPRFPTHTLAVPARVAPYPILSPLYTPCKPPLNPL